MLLSKGVKMSIGSSNGSDQTRYLRSHVGQSAINSPAGIPVANCDICGQRLYEGMTVRGYVRRSERIREIYVAGAACGPDLSLPGPDPTQYREFTGTLVPRVTNTGFEYLYVALLP